MTIELPIIAPHIISVRSDWDIIAARMAARHLARTIGFNTIDQARIATATSELTRNILQYAGEGQVTMGNVQHDHREGIEIIFADQGPGINKDDTYIADNEPLMLNIAEHMKLHMLRNLVDEVDIDSEADHGTTITLLKWLI
jgi:serine/threonine-protein kinase RsbT